MKRSQPCTKLGNGLFKQEEQLVQRPCGRMEHSVFEEKKGQCGWSQEVGGESAGNGTTEVGRGQIM